MLNILLLLLSIIVITTFGLNSLIFISLSAISTYFTGKYLEKHKNKPLLIFIIILNLLPLIFFRFTYLVNKFNILVPIGLSYYTLSVISYIVDVYKNETKSEKNILNYLLYVFYLPYIFIGPISRYKDVSKTMFTKKKFDITNTYKGLLRISWGFFKKYLIASRISLVISSITSNNLVGAYALLACILYSIELYSDFSGGIDMVIGVSNIFGIKLKENFNVPYISETIKEFWGRWHIALSSFLKDYVYIPLGGNRVSKIRNKINIIITFLVSGFWHGTTYILWGLFHGILVCTGNLFKTKNKYINIFITFILTSLLWSFFIWNTSFIEPLKMILSIFTHFNYITLFKNLTEINLTLFNIVVLILSILILTIYDLKQEKINNKISNLSPVLKTSLLCITVILVFTLGVYGIGFNHSEFIYSKF